MEKGKKLISLLLVLVLLFSLSSISLATKEDSKLNDFLGKYRGSYYANQGHTGLTLEVYKDEDMNYKASFNFYSVPENPSVPAGEYICDVEYDEDTDEYIIIGKEWITKPETYEFVDLYGKYEDFTYIGKVASRSGRSYTFDLTKQVEENQPSSWAEDTVDSAVLEGIVPLELQGNYKDPITRSEFTRLMIATISKEENKDIEQILSDNNIKKNTFVDTDDEFVLAAYELGIIEGYGNGYFGPDDLLTREQAAVILRRMLNLFDVYNSNSRKMNFKDEHSFSNWAKEDIEFITSCYIGELNISIMAGVGEDFNPQGRYTKEQSYLTVYRLLKYAEYENNEDLNSETFNPQGADSPEEIKYKFLKAIDEKDYLSFINCVNRDDISELYFDLYLGHINSRLMRGNLEGSLDYAIDRWNGKEVTAYLTYDIVRNQNGKYLIEVTNGSFEMTEVGPNAKMFVHELNQMYESNDEGIIYIESFPGHYSYTLYIDDEIVLEDGFSLTTTSHLTTTLDYAIELNSYK